MQLVSTPTGQTRGPGRPREFDIDEALDQAITVFSERGYHGTSITDLTQAMGLTAGSLYKAFKDKRAVFLAALERHSAVRNAQMMQAIGGATTGRARLRGALLFYAGLSWGAEGRRGCLMVGTAVELSAVDAEIAARVAAALTLREKLLADMLGQGRHDGSVRASLPLKATARCMLCLLQGMRVVGKTAPTRAEMEAAVEVALHLLD